MDLLSGDRSHLLFYLRTISFGPKYSFRVTMRDGVDQTVETDVSKLKVRRASVDLAEPFVIQADGHTYEGRLSRGSDEQAIIQARLRTMRDDPKRGAEPAPRETLRRLLVTVDGSSDPDVIAKHINGLVAGKAQQLRRALGKPAPGLDMEIDVTNDRTGEPESFFRAEE
jgi:hypothetical protein